jgi:DNA-binding IscR family transcriptional regulator
MEEPWQKINNTVKNALEGISLNEMMGKNQNEGLLNLSMNYSGGM